MTSPEAISSATFYRVDGTHFAFGLEWMTAAANKQSIDQAKAAAKKQRATHAAWRLAKAQVGLTRIDQEVPERSLFSPWRSAAAAFADLPYSSLLAAFKFRDGRIWILAATNGRIYAKGDRVFLNEEDARRYFDELFAQQYWNDIFAPADWQSRAKQIDPLAVLRRKRSDGRVAGVIEEVGAALGLVSRPGVSLQPLIADFKALEKPKLIAAAAGLCVVAAAGIGYTRWHAAHVRKPQVAAPAPYYPTIGNGGQTLALCIKALLGATTRHQTPGWTLTEATCSGDQVVATLVPDADTPSTTMMAFHPEAEMRSRKQALIQVDVTAAPQETLTLPLVTDEAYQNAFAVTDERSNSTNVIGPALPPIGMAPAQYGRQRPRPYRVSQWSFDTTAPPLIWEPDLAAIRNIEVISVTLAVSEHGLSWRIKGNAYVAP